MSRDFRSRDRRRAGAANNLIALVRSINQESSKHAEFSFQLPSVSMSQGASTGCPGMIKSNQYLPLTACLPSLALISLHVSAGSSGMEPRGTGTQKDKQ